MLLFLIAIANDLARSLLPVFIKQTSTGRFKSLSSTFYDQGLVYEKDIRTYYFGIAIG
jgi:hypothetical protein